MQRSNCQKLYVPPYNPLAKSKLIRTYTKKDGTTVQAHWSKPKYRHNVNPICK